MNPSKDICFEKLGITIARRQNLEGNIKGPIMKKQKPKNYLLVLTDLEKAISEGNIEDLKSSSNLIIAYTSDVETQLTWRDYYDSTNNPIGSTNLVILACKHNQVKILEYILDSDREILNNLSIGIGRPIILPDDEDESRHNAFYYAIRSCNVDLLDTLINKWPHNYFAVHLEKLDEILSRTYEELKLKNVPLSDEIQGFVENKLINLRFYSNDSRSNPGFKSDLNNIRERIDLILENISLLQTDYSNTEEVDKKFLFVAKFIAQNIHILKRQLKSAYIRLPWEEMEFCLTTFVSTHTKWQEVNLFYRVTLDKNKIINHLEHFAKKLEAEKVLIQGKNTEKLDQIPKLKRDQVVAEIISSYPPFEELYKDYQQIRDIHSLEKINVYIQLALSADPKERDGQLIITRALQVIGEHLKNTLESPKLSKSTSELFLLSLPRNAREIIVDLRNSLSHAYSLSKRIEIEENCDINFFINVQNDTKKVGDVITDILYNNKIKTIRILLTKIVNSKNANELKKVAELFKTVEFDKIVAGNFKMLEHEKLEKIVKELSDIITDKTNYEKELFKKINNLINGSGTRSENNSTDYVTGIISLKSLTHGFGINKIDHNIIRGRKFQANQILQTITSKLETNSLKEIAKLSTQISHSVGSRLPNDNLDKVNYLICEIYYIAEFGTSDIKWIEELREKLNEKDTFIPTHPQRKINNLTEEKYNKQLELKLSELKGILNKNSLCGPVIEKFTFYKSDKKLQAVVEMLVLDIMSILGSSKLENNLLFLDDNSPLLTGKCLRNHLAHNNVLIDILLCDPSMAIILNAKKLTDENIMTNKKKIGQLIREDPIKLREKFNRGLATITDEERMFVVLEEGNIDILKDCLTNGTDINARSFNSWTTLHFAAKGPSLEVIKFILGQNVNVNVRDSDGQSPLHIAAMHGRQDIVNFFIKEKHLNVDILNNIGDTPLHLAAQNGQKDTVEVLLKNESDTVIKNISGLSPLHCAIRNNHVDVVKMLLKKDINVDINETMGGFTPLHEAAKFGHLQLVNFLLRNQANVNANTDNNCIPLHTAAFNGHLEVVNALILKGANVNARVMDGCTPLHYAVGNGHEKIANILLKHGANVDIVDKTYHNTPLHYATKDGHEGIVKSLLKNKANANIATIAGITPLHFAVRSGHLEIVAVLLQHGIRINAQDKNDDTPLHYAAESGHREGAELLIKNGAKTNAKNVRHITPLYIAALQGHKDVANLLIKNKAEINAHDIMGSTPLHAAAMKDSQDIIDLLIKNNAQVDTRTFDGMAPLHLAAFKGHVDAITLLIKNKADVNARANFGLTPLYSAVEEGHKDVVNLLIKHEAQVNTIGIDNSTPLYAAIQAGHKEIVEILVTSGANVNDESNNLTPLISAIKFNHKEILEVLIANGAKVNVEGFDPLALAVIARYRDIVEILLKHKALVNIKGPENVTSLHLAAKRGYKRIVNTLITNGADVDALAIKNVTPLCVAAQEGHAEVVEILIANGANVNFKCDEDGTPLHMAAASGHNDVVKVLLHNKAKIYIKDHKRRTPLELAVAHGRLKVVKMLLKYDKVDMDREGNDGWTLLHIASQESNLELVKYLVEEGSDINARNASGAKSIHIAAREGHRDTMEFFLSKGLNINDRGAANQTLIHYAAMKGHLENVNYLIAQGADVNIRDANGQTPTHIAATFGYKDVTEVLLKYGAVYNAFDNFYKRPLGIAKDENVINLLASTDKLFEAVKYNRSSDVKIYIKAGAFVDAKNVKNVTPLHYAAWKGYEEVVNVLLQNKANANVVGNKGITPLHYAAQFSHLKVVKTLLSNSAVYNAVSVGGKTPSDFTVEKSITSLLDLVDESFKKVNNGNSQVIRDLNKIKDIDTLKAVMNARNRENQTLVVAAMHSNFSKVDQLKEISQGDSSAQVGVASVLLIQGKYQEALSIYKSVFEKRKEILGSDNPGTLDIQRDIAKVFYKQGAYREALNTFEEIFQKQKEMLGLNNKDTLSTRSSIALVLHRQGKDEEALNSFQEVYQKQKEILGPNHLETLNTWFHMAPVLKGLGKDEEALYINRTVFEKMKKIFGANHPMTVGTQTNIAMVLAKQGNSEEALKIYKEVFVKMKVVLGMNHPDTLGTLHNIAVILGQQKKYHEALKAHEEVLNIQKNCLGPNHPDTLNSRYNMANILFDQGKWIGAFRAYKESLDQLKAVFGPSHPSTLDSLAKIETLNKIFKVQGSDTWEVIQHLQKEINIAADNGDVQTIQRLIKDGAEINDKNIDGRTPLHFAVSNGHKNVVNILLKNGADVTQVTNKGNTPLHTATSKGFKEIIEVLLQHVGRDTLNDFINAKTTAGGTASLHVAAKNGFLDVTKSLLKRGAIYDIKNSEGKTPFDLSQEQNVNNFLKLVEELFEDAQQGNVKFIDKLRAMQSDDLVTVTNARNNQGKTLLQVVIANKHKNVLNQLLAILKKPN